MSQQLENDIDQNVGAKLMRINGRSVPALSGKTIDIHDPSTGRIIGTTPDGSAADVDSAVQAASRSFQSGVWRKMPAAERAKILWRAADLIESHADEIGRLEALNSGMLHSMARYMPAASAEYFRYYAGWATKIHGITSNVSLPGMPLHAYTLKEPVGVCGLIVPWNFPLTLASTKLAAALAVGCSCVLKPSEETPFTALRLAEILEEAGLPPGVLNVVTGYGETVGAAIAAHDQVAKVAFTGSTAVGKAIVRAAAGNLKKVTLELGGKSPVIVFDDADLDASAAGIAAGIFQRSGQVCVAGSRLYVQRKSFDRVVGAIAEAASGMRVGSAFDPDANIGPLISLRQQERVADLIASGKTQGGNVVLGGNASENGGYFVDPTIVTHLPNEARLLKEEVFGPVLVASPFDELDDVLHDANQSQYGLAGYVWTRDIAKAHLTAERLEAGLVWLNCAMVSDPSLPAGGYKQSGWGRELGREGLDAYLETKSVVASLG
ncbi:aldehyde dehydrogenase family protein [Sphingobium aromaticivastans]|uniref:aldehyde dehydrogenase family protein n=1 Tax=Sphingobium aromaticivastans TaxID=1778665 RepID=UPI003019F9A6